MTPERLGPYPIEREIGRGGMGIVYLGRDPRLDRPVAIKVLPEPFAADPERLARFEREARLLASLSHPHIAGIHGLEESDGQRFLALEYVEGETLAEHLRRGPLPLEETLEVCRQIASALEAAHEAGIVHRDLKPGNVKRTPAGDVKVLDFGLARGAAPAADSSLDLSQSPTLTAQATGVGVILGTAAYMSPEQARGRQVDRRTDIWSFGCVLYECLTGSQAFSGETLSDTIAMILQGEPDFAPLPPRTPEKLRVLLARCLEKDPRRRLRDIGDARIEIEELLGARASRAAVARGALAGSPESRPTRRPGREALLLAGGLVAGAIAWSLLGPAPREGAPMRFTILAPVRHALTGDPNHHAISPDGRTLAFAAQDSAGQVTLWLRPLDDFEARPLPGTRGAELPFWSPDGRHVGFFADGKLKRVRVSGGSPETLCDAPSGRGASWSRSGTIVFGPGPTGPLYRVEASGGAPLPVTAIDTTSGENAHRWPCFLPDGEHFLYAGLPARNGLFPVYVASLRDTGRQAVLSARNAAIYAAPGYLIFSRGEALLAQRFDPGRRALRGEPFRIGDEPAASNYSASPSASVSATGVLAWQSAGTLDTRFIWFDREGREVGSLGIAPDRWFRFSFAPDGRRAIAQREVAGGNAELWLVDLERETASRLVHGQGWNEPGLWTRDGREIIYESQRGGPRDLYRRPVDGSAAETVVYRSAVPFKNPLGWSADGRSILMQEIKDDTGWNLLILPLEGGAPAPYLVTPYHERNADVSRDGKWAAYISDESGMTQAYVQSFPVPGDKQQVTRTGAFGAVWRADGRELFLFRSDFTVIGVPVEPGPPLRLGTPRTLARYPADLRWLAPTPDGRRFLATIPVDRPTPGIGIAVDWHAGVEE